MDYLIGFILGFLACAILWGLRELERRQVFEDAAEALDAERKENRRLRAQGQSHYEMFTYLKDGVSNIRKDLGGKGALPSPAMSKAEGPELQHVSQPFARRITAKLTGLPGSGGPDFFLEVRDEQ